MKWNKFFTLCIGVGLLTVGCSSDEAVVEEKAQDSPNIPTPMSFNAEQLETVDIANNLAFNIFSDIKNNDAATDKYCISPLSIFNLISMTANGASDETVSYILEMLNISDGTRNDIQMLNEACKEFVLKLPVQDRLVDFSMTNSFWHDPSISAMPTFSDVMSKYYGGSVINQNPGGLVGKDVLNKWVNEKTKGMIPTLLDEPMDCDIALLNTVYFKGKWAEPFKKTNTFKADFNNADGSKSQVDLMNDKIMSKVYADDKFVMASLPFGNGSYAMAFVMSANDNNSVSFTHEDWKKMRNGAHSQQMKVFVPKFSFEYGTDVFEILNRLYPNKLSRIAFTNLVSSGNNAELNTFLHKTQIKIYEEGCEAAAAGVIAGVGANVPREIRFDRPFYFVLHEKTTGAILFLGYISAF